MASNTIIYPDVLDPIESASREYLDRHQEASLAAMCEHAVSNAPLIRRPDAGAKLAPHAR